MGPIQHIICQDIFDFRNDFPTDTVNSFPFLNIPPRGVSNCSAMSLALLTSYVSAFP